MSDVPLKNGSAFEREENDHYVDPAWCTELLLKSVKFRGKIWDPACGFGTIPEACKDAGHNDVLGTDLVYRGYGSSGQDFLKFSRKHCRPVENIVTNPPYKHTEAFIEQALRFTTDKVAVLVPLKFLASNTRYFLFTELPTWRVVVLSSRPSMLPGHRILAGEKPGGGAIEYCWIVFKHGYDGTCGVTWAKRANAKARPYGTNRARKASPEAALQGGA